MLAARCHRHHLQLAVFPIQVSVHLFNKSALEVIKRKKDREPPLEMLRSGMKALVT